MYSSVFLVIVASLTLASAQLPSPPAARFVGCGYNILTGNPDGDSQRSGGTDPGLLPTRTIFQLSYENNKKSQDNKYRVPDETEYLQRSTSVTSKESKTFYGAASYANELSSSVNTAASVNSIFASVEFAASYDYKKISNDASTEGYVYEIDQTTQNLGHIRYLKDLARADKYNMSTGFIAAVSSLPTTYNKDQYMDFIEDWGTHVVTELNVGIRSGTTTRSSRSSFMNAVSKDHSGSVSVGGSYKIASASVSVDMGQFTSGKTSEKNIGEKYTSYRVGSETLNEPISLTLIGIEEALADDYWTNQALYEQDHLCPSGWNRKAIQTNLQTALRGYAEYKKVKPSTESSSITFPLTWPEGQYAIPKPGMNGKCPDTDYMVWDQGEWRIYTKKGGKNQWSPTSPMSAGMSQDHIQLSFCVKTVPKVSEYSWNWMPGSYCIFKFGADCPSGFEEGSIKYMEEGTAREYGFCQGLKPEGEYTNTYSNIQFCCRNDGRTANAIILPTKSNFYLIRYYEHCQTVKGMDVSTELIDAATYSSTETLNKKAFPKPGATVILGKPQTKISLCYYKPSTGKRAEDVAEPQEEYDLKEAFFDRLEEKEREEAAEEMRVEKLLSLLQKLK